MGILFFFFFFKDLRDSTHQAFNCPVYSSHAYAVHVHITYSNDIVFVKQVSRDENFTDVFWSSQNCSESNVTKILTGKIVFLRANSSTPNYSILVSNYGKIVVVIHNYVHILNDAIMKKMRIKCIVSWNSYFPLKTVAQTTDKQMDWLTRTSRRDNFMWHRSSADTQFHFLSTTRLIYRFIEYNCRTRTF